MGGRPCKSNARNDGRKNQRASLIIPAEEITIDDLRAHVNSLDFTDYDPEARLIPEELTDKKEWTREDMLFLSRKWSDNFNLLLLRTMVLYTFPGLRTMKELDIAIFPLGHYIEEKFFANLHNAIVTFKANMYFKDIMIPLKIEWFEGVLITENFLIHQ